MRTITRGLFILLACGQTAAIAQCDLALQETFRFGLRPHGGNGQLRAPDVGDGLGGYWPQLPAEAIWQAAQEGWIFAAASTDPLELDALDPFNGVAFMNGAANTAALLPFTPPATRFTLSLEIAIGQIAGPVMHLGFTSSAALADNFITSGSLWVTIDYSGAWQLFINGSQLIASGQGDYSYSLNSGWLPMELTMDPGASTASGTIGGSHFGPIPVTLTNPIAQVGFEARGNFFNAVNNMRITTGVPLAVSVPTPTGSPVIGGQVTFAAATNAADPSGFGWRRGYTTVLDGATPWGSVISGATTRTLTISNLKAEDFDSYTAIVFNACGMRASDPVQIASCYANCDQSAAPPILNANDFACFLNNFAAASPYANCDLSTAPPTLNALDFSCFLSQFAAGCT